MCVRDRRDWEALKNEANDVKELFTYARWLSINAPLTRLSISYMAKQMYQYTSRPIKRTKYNLAIDNVLSLGEEKGGVKMWMVPIHAPFLFAEQNMWTTLCDTL